jgi:hypothetical protein
MRHPDASLAAYVDGTATTRERATAEAHLATCESCRRDFRRAKAARAAAAGLPDKTAPGIDVAAVIEAATMRSGAAARRPAQTRARERAPAGAAAAPELEAAALMATEEWAPEAPLAEGELDAATPALSPADLQTVVVEEGGELKPDQEATVTELPGEEERTRRKRDRDRAWQMRVAQAALGAAAILVAIVLFVGLRTESQNTGATAGAPLREGGASPSVPADRSFGAASSFNEATLTSYAQTLAAQIDDTGAVPDAVTTPPERQSTLTGKGSAADRQLACIQQGTGLVAGNRLYQLLEATYLDQPVYIGAFLADVRSDQPTLLVLAVSVDGCVQQKILREELHPA